MGDKLVLDLETKKSFDEVGGQQNTAQLEVSVCGVYSYDRDEFRAFKEEEFKELGEWLKAASLIIGFNSKSFDFTVLQPYYKFNLSKLPHLDILEEVYHALGHRLKLDSIAQSTLGFGKSGSGLDALWYFKNNDWDSLIKYCLDDVRVTREVYEYGRRHGHLWYDSMGRHETIPIRWGNGQTIKDLILNAYKSGEQVEIDYLKTDTEERGKRNIDIKAVKNNQIQAFCHKQQAIRVFNIDRIFDVKTMGRQGHWQNKLF
ncbi:MAG: ribonuclease H-like domain-containing protein [Candidatus Komeilibacteria bacterium]|nr:ribonuclease H-like domain-containing protein [Candidatus Komeilibacteria bacterium]